MERWMVPFLALVVSVQLSVLLAGVVDLVYRYRAQPALFACEAQRMLGRRRIFTDSVVCVPVHFPRPVTPTVVQWGLA
jgi:hypothetical protein